jgi:RHS repeat-associated protein
MQLWSYFADGKLQSQTDQAGLRDTHAYDLNGNQTSLTEALGAGNPSSAVPVTVTASYDGFNQLSKVRIPKNQTTNYWATLFTYDQHGNPASLTENQEENVAGDTIITTGRKQTYTYNTLNQLTTQLDDYATTGTSDDERFDYTYTPLGQESHAQVNKANGTGGWITEQYTDKTYYANGLLKTLTTNTGVPTLISTHTLTYIRNGVYLNGNKGSDTFQLKGPDNTAPCYSTTCTASWGYDARDRLIVEADGTGSTTAYSLDIYSNITQETQNAGIARTAAYTGLQLTSDTAGSTTKKYLYDSQGNLNCVVTNAWAGTSCPNITGSIDPSLITYNSFDTKNRLTATYSYSSGTLTDSANYTLDALDRTLSETEYHTNSQNGPTGRTDTTYIGLSTAVSQEQLFNTGGTLTETKSYAYDSNGRRTTLADAVVGGATNRYSYTYDSHGSVELLIDQANTVKASYGYTAYGASNPAFTRTAAGFGLNTNPYRYAGQRFDTGSNTVDFSARRYSPGIERFVQRDSYFGALSDLGLSTDPLNGNRYVLTGANPINFVEFDGHRPEVGAGDYAVWQYNGSTLVTFGGSNGGGSTTANSVVVSAASQLASIASEAPKSAGVVADTKTLGSLLLDIAANTCGHGGVCEGPASNPWQDLFWAVPGGRIADKTLALLDVAGNLGERLAGKFGRPLAGAAIKFAGWLGIGKAKVPLILANQAKGVAAEREIGALFKKAGYDVDYQVVKNTPFGKRRIDVQLSKDGEVLGGLEIKTGSSRYLPSQRAKDYWLGRWDNYRVQLVPLG